MSALNLFANRFIHSIKQPDINQGIQDFRQTADAVLLDVRTPQEYRSGHVPGSQNLPLQSLDRITNIVNNRNIPLFVYCQSGGRSRQAAAILQQMGYPNVKNLGGIANYHGKVE